MPLTIVQATPRRPPRVRLRELGRALPPEPPLPLESLLNFDAMTKMLLERGHVRLPEGELIAFQRMNDPYLAGSPSIDGRTQQAISAAIQAPDYARGEDSGAGDLCIRRSEQAAAALVRPERQGVDRDSCGAFAHQRCQEAREHRAVQSATSRRDRYWRCRTPRTTSSSRTRRKCWTPSRRLPSNLTEFQSRSSSQSLLVMMPMTSVMAVVFVLVAVQQRRNVQHDELVVVRRRQTHGRWTPGSCCRR